ncbi:hypothetical protein JNB_06409 [Janibacter sp. HTCC2649]|uniref:HNH endonuclease signature motif containing protein n=1 Tax=Janibacter sp. HTCC2649 TaxID=313589 RepID=UPI0000670C53|nr:HNH endonuclease signature motif containing protein [Janibacter sp. HTCC2649]EAP99779.1 hypothetical protein JNB_06409 [Janibacter sp. HTCC2649]
MESTAATAALEGRYAALRASAHELSSEELLDVIELAQREKDVASARQAVALAHLSARDFHRQEDGTSVEVHHGLGHQRQDGPELAAPRLGCSVHMATNRILDAIRQLTRTPAVVDAMASGDLDEQRARVVTEETEFLSAESAAEVVERVKDVWGQLTTGPLRRLLARTAAQVDPDAVAQEAEDERARRGLTRRTGEHGTDHWRGDFRVEDARGAWAAVTERARQLVRDKKASNLEMARSDAMMELILEHSDVRVIVHATRAADDEARPTDTTADETTPADETTTADEAAPADETASSWEAAAPTGASGAAEDLVEVGGLGQGGTTFVPRGWLDAAGTSNPDRDLTCDNDTGALVHGDVPAAFARGQGRARHARRKAERCGQDLEDFSQSYRVPDGMARLIRLRDGSCRFPGCGVPSRQCDLDHVRPWPAGPTSPTNLMALCRRHHQIKQRDGWTVKLHPDSTVTWTDPTGLQRTTWPVDHLHLITAGHTQRDSKTSASPGQPVEFPTTFEEELYALLDADTRKPLHARPCVRAFDGTLLSGPRPHIDLDAGHGLPTKQRPRITFVFDAPPTPPPRPDIIPF